MQGQAAHRPGTATRTDRGRARDVRAEKLLEHRRLVAPVSVANIARNARAEPDRAARWRPMRHALWELVEPHLSPGARVAVVGAGNADDLPLTRLADRAGQVVLFDLDETAARAARRREPRVLRSRIDVSRFDVTAGAADAIVLAAVNEQVPWFSVVPERPLPGAPYDLVVGDLLYTQLLFPALRDSGAPRARIEPFLSRYGPPLTRGVVARLHASAPGGHVVHLHDPLLWQPDRRQSFSLDDVLTHARSDIDAALRLVAKGTGPTYADPRAALTALGLPMSETRLWRWPFAEDVEYLVAAVLSSDRRPAD